VTAQSTNVPAPVGGWNTKDSLADMAEDNAPILDNWFPREGRVDVRPGYSSYATGMTGDVETLAEYIDGSNRKFIAAANSKLWNISSAGAASEIGTGYTNNRWDTINMDGKIGLCNGQDTTLQWDGTTLSTLTITGVTSSTLIGCNVFSGRSYWWADNSQSIWYSAVNTLGGSLTEFNLSRVGQFGGKVMAMGTWTYDAGDGPDDFAVFFMSGGDTLVYQGTSPSDFSIVGVFKLGEIVARRGIIKLGGDLLAMTTDGYISLKGAISQGRVTDRGILSDQINPTVTENIKALKSNFGWQAFHYPRGNMLMFNVPLSTNTTYQQHVFNTNTGSPCRFKNIPSRCWGIYNDKAYFGGSGVVYLFDDDTDDIGNNIEADAQPAWNYLGDKSLQDHVTAVQPVMASTGAIAISIHVEADFKKPTVGYMDTTFVGGASSWGTATWNVDEWSGGDQITREWQNTEAFGFTVSPRVRVRKKGQEIKWYSINYMHNRGGLV